MTSWAVKVRGRRRGRRTLYWRRRFGTWVGWLGAGPDGGMGGCRPYGQPGSWLSMTGNMARCRSVGGLGMLGASIIRSRSGAIEFGSTIKQCPPSVLREAAESGIGECTWRERRASYVACKQGWTEAGCSSSAGVAPAEFARLQGSVGLDGYGHPPLMANGKVNLLPLPAPEIYRQVTH